MKGYKTNIETEALENTNFRKVLYTASHFQLVLMSLQPQEEIGNEVHITNDQFFRIESGQGTCVIDGHKQDVHDGDIVVIPAGAQHNIINTSKSQFLKMYTIYAPPHHKDKIVRETKKEAIENEAFYVGITSE